MKTRIILLMFVCVSCTVFAQSISTVVTNWGQISLVGRWKGDDFGDDKGNRSIPHLPVIASIENAVVTLEFEEAAGGVTVTISKDGRTVLSRSLSVDVPGSHCIPVDTYAPGVYLLELTNSDGGHVYGWFELK